MSTKKLKLYVAESQGCCVTNISFIKAEGDGVILQFKKDIRGTFVNDHDDDEYLYLNKSYGFAEVYDYIKAKTLNEAITKMKKLNKEIKKGGKNENWNTRV